MDHTAWRYQTRYLAHHGRRVLAFDLPGHGLTPGPALSTVEEMAGWVSAQLRSQGRPAEVIGQSLGGLIALELAAHEPDLVSTLTILGCAASMPVSEALQTAADEGSPDAVAMIISWSYARPRRLGGHPEPGLWQTGVSARLLERGLGTTLGIDLTACNNYDGGTVAAGLVRQACLIVAGRQDRMVQVKAVAKLADAISGARFETIEAGHMMILESPEAVRRLLADFVPSG